MLLATEDKLLRFSQVQEMLSLTRPTVSDWVSRGYLTEIVLPSGQRRIPLSEVQRVLDGGQKVPA